MMFTLLLSSVNKLEIKCETRQFPSLSTFIMKACFLLLKSKYFRPFFSVMGTGGGDEYVFVAAKKVSFALKVLLVLLRNL